MSDTSQWKQPKWVAVAAFSLSTFFTSIWSNSTQIRSNYKLLSPTFDKNRQVGKVIKFSPFLTPMATGVLKTGMVITIEPGIYLPTWGGVRIEDDVLVTEDGFEVLTSAPKEIDQCVVSMC